MKNAAKIDLLETLIEELRSLNARDLGGTVLVAAVRKHGWDPEEITTAKIDRAIREAREDIEYLRPRLRA